MQYQTFTGTDLKEALGAVRAAYGPDALIGPTRHVQVPDVRGGPQLRVEVQAAPSAGRSAWPFANGVLSSSVDDKRRALPKLRKPVQLQQKVTEAVQKLPLNLQHMEAQIAELRGMIESMQAQLPSKQRALALLSELGIEGAVARQLGGRMGKSKNDAELLERIRQRLCRALSEPEDILSSKQPELIACVGPTGAGKTTTLAKMAAQARLDHGKTVALISLDHFRVGAAEQWQRYGKLMGMPVFTPKGPQELEEILASNPAQLLLVDTPSVGSSQDASMRSFAELAHKAKRRTHVMLVLPAWLRGNDAESLVRRYEHLSPTSLCITKMDETEGIGGAVQAAVSANLPINYLSRGPRVPEHLELATLSQILQFALLPGEPSVH
jgi:flagellar biosynthesis protein FlhF